MEAQLLGHRLPLLDRLTSRSIDHGHQDPRALDVSKEVVPEAPSRVRALDEAGDVGHDRGALTIDVERDHAEVGRDGRERVVPHLGPRLGQRRQQG